MSVKLRFTNWLRDYMDNANRINLLSSMEEQIMVEKIKHEQSKAAKVAKKIADTNKTYTPTDEAYDEANEKALERLGKYLAEAQEGFSDLDKQEVIDRLNKRISDQLDEIADLKKQSNWDLIFSLIPTPVLKELYDRLEEGNRAIEENKRIKASLENVNDAIKKMFKLI